jgi:hypothetical protein
MGLEIELAGDLITASLVARELEGDAGQGGEKIHAPCANCGTPVTAHYCGHCGQKGHLHKSVLHLGEELIHGLLHFDTKGWRTLPMLMARPGQLTRRYIDGQRTRFVSPLALFLFMMFFMFFVFSLTMGSAGDAVTTGIEANRKYVEGSQGNVERAREGLAEAEERVKEAEAGSREAERAQKSLEKARIKLAAAEVTLKNAQAKLAAGTSTASEAAPAEESEKGTEALKTIAKEAGVGQDYKTKTYSDVPWINKAVKHAVDNPELAKYKLKSAAYKYSFLLVPISMPFLWLMFFWKRRITMYDHAVFSLYSLSFMSLLFVAVATLGYFGFAGWAVGLVAVVPPIHMYLQLRDTYQLARFSALWRTCALLFMSVLVLSLYSLVVLALSAT